MILGKIWDMSTTFLYSIPLLAMFPFATIGAFYLLSKLPTPLMAFYRHYIRKPLDLASRYGPNSWVLVTGGAKGIGQGFAQEFAKRGFNIIIIDRDDKISETATRLKNDYKVNVIEIKKDLMDIDEVLKDVNRLMTTHDISVLINNAALKEFKDYKSQDMPTIEAIFKTNIEVPTKLTRTLINYLKARPRRSAIINLSSILGTSPTPHALIYSCTKVYLRYFSAGLREEVGDKIDILSVEPGVVSTDFEMNPDPNYFTATVDECVQGSMKELGRGIETHGARKHALGAWYYNMNPDLEVRSKKFSELVFKTLDWEMKTGKSA